MTECNRCGDCCENMELNFTKGELRDFVARRGDGGATTPIAQAHLANAYFILRHWHRSGGGGTKTRYACDRFDAATRLCTAHEDRPPICQGFPWYGAPPPVGTVVRLPRRCSFNADVGVPVAAPTARRRGDLPSAGCRASQGA